PYWVQDPSATYIAHTMRFGWNNGVNQNSAYNPSLYDEIITPPLPESGVLDVLFIPSFDDYTSPAPGYPKGTVTIGYVNSDGDSYNNAQYVATAPIGGSYGVDLAAVTIGEGPRRYSRGRVEVFNGSNWTFAQGDWRRHGTGDAIDLLHLLVQRCLFMDAKSRRVSNGPARYGGGDPLSKFSYENYIWYMMSGSYVAADNAWAGNYMSLSDQEVSIGIGTGELPSNLTYRPVVDAVTAPGMDVAEASFYGFG